MQYTIIRTKSAFEKYYPSKWKKTQMQTIQFIPKEMFQEQQSYPTALGMGSEYDFNESFSSFLIEVQLAKKKHIRL